MSKRVHRLWSAAVSVTLVLAGCGAPAPEPVPVAAGRSVEVTLTFDDMPMAASPSKGTRLDTTRSIIATLDRFGVEGAYGFVNGKNVDTPTRGEAIAVLEAWIASGNYLGSHTYSHYSLEQIRPTDFMTDIRRNEPILASVSSEERYKVFRYPFLMENDEGNHGPEIRKFLRNRGYTISPVTLNVGDWMYPAAYSRCLAADSTEEQEWLRTDFVRYSVDRFRQGREMSRVVLGRDVKHVLLLHQSEFVADVLGDLLAALQEEGAQLVSHDEAMTDPMYAENQDIVFPQRPSLLHALVVAKGLSIPTEPLFSKDRLAQICR